MLDIKLPITRREDIISKLMSRVFVCPITQCWIWTGPTSGSGKGGGYGRMCLDNQTVATHLVSYTHFYGYIPGKRQIDHKCNNRLCCNPTHLESVTHKQNQIRKSKRVNTEIPDKGINSTT